MLFDPGACCDCGGCEVRLALRVACEPIRQPSPAAAGALVTWRESAAGPILGSTIADADGVVFLNLIGHSAGRNYWIEASSPHGVFLPYGKSHFIGGNCTAGEFVVPTANLTDGYCCHTLSPGVGVVLPRTLYLTDAVGTHESIPTVGGCAYSWCVVVDDVPVSNCARPADAVAEPGSIEVRYNLTLSSLLNARITRAWTQANYPPGSYVPDPCVGAKPPCDAGRLSALGLKDNPLPEMLGIAGVYIAFDNIPAGGYADPIGGGAVVSS